jgi:hypothetical protein
MKSYSIPQIYYLFGDLILDLEFDDNLVLLPAEKGGFYRERRTIESTIYLKVV